MKKGHLFFVMWVSGAGKGTLIEGVKNTDLNLHFPLSYKTRPKREFEINWVDAHFVSTLEFEKGIENNEFLEHAIVHKTDYYGTKLKEVVEEWIEQWKIVIKEIDVLWLEKIIKNNSLDKNNYSTIFLNIDIEILKERIQIRWDKISEKQLKNRVESSYNEIKIAEKICDYILDASKTQVDVLQEFLNIIKK